MAQNNANGGTQTARVFARFCLDGKVIFSQFAHIRPSRPPTAPPAAAPAALAKRPRIDDTPISDDWPSASLKGECIPPSFIVANHALLPPPAESLTWINISSAGQQDSRNKEEREIQENTHNPNRLNPSDLTPLYSISSWFSPSCVSEFERAALPELFARGRKDAYQQIRNTIMQASAAAPDQYLSVSACVNLPSLSGVDVSVIIRVFDFLSRYSLVNQKKQNKHTITIEANGFAASDYPIVNQAALSRPLAPSSDPLSNLVSSLYGFAPDRRTVERELFGGLMHAFEPTNATNSTAADRAACEGRVCASCCSLCSSDYYVNIHDRLMLVCPSCFASGRYSAIINERDFEHVEPGFSGLWSEPELLSLLEGVKQCGPDFDQIASDYVKTKSREECAIKFLQMPLEDPFILDQGTAPHILPFSDANNPLLSQVFFLFHALSPPVAAAAAQSAVARLTESANNEAAQSGDLLLDERVLVSTPYGLGTCAVKALVSGQAIAEVRLGWATAFMEAAQVKPRANAFKALGQKTAAAAINPQSLAQAQADAFKGAASVALELAQQEKRKLLKQSGMLASLLLKQVDYKQAMVKEFDNFLRSAKEALDKQTRDLRAEKEKLENAAEKA